VNKEKKSSNNSRIFIYELEKKFLEARMNYYRFVIRNEDKSVISRLIKIPDNWQNYKSENGVKITENVMARLSDVKKKMTWELKLQSLYFYSIVNIENIIISAMQQNPIDESELQDAVDSINTIILELESEFFNIKHLLLTLAKRSISDFYYLVSSYCKYFMKKSFNFENDIKTLLSEFIKIINQQYVVNKNVDMFITLDRKISSLFEESSNALGWRMNEFAVKDYLEKDNPFVMVTEMANVAKEAFSYKNSLKNYYYFLKYYYNESEGKLFRLNFISDSLKVKLNDKKISEDVFNSFEDIRLSFISYKSLFDKTGLSGFGHEKMSYYELLNFIFKLCKIIEFYYLRNMKYNDLQDFRNEIYYYVENEIISINNS
jgi:hypothetical protein